METLTPAFSALRTWMIISIVLYAGGLLTFAFGQNLLLENINRTSEKLFGDRFPLIPLSSEKFWLVLTNSMMIMLVVICAMAALDVHKYYPLIIVLLFSKASSTLQYLYLFFTKRYFAYLVGALSDGPLFLITLYFYLSAV